MPKRLWDSIFPALGVRAPDTHATPAISLEAPGDPSWPHSLTCPTWSSRSRLQVSREACGKPHSSTIYPAGWPSTPSTCPSIPPAAPPAPAPAPVREPFTPVVTPETQLLDTAAGALLFQASLCETEAHGASPETRKQVSVFSNSRISPGKRYQVKKQSHLPPSSCRRNPSWLPRGPLGTPAAQTPGTSLESVGNFAVRPEVGTGTPSPSGGVLTPGPQKGTSCEDRVRVGPVCPCEA